MENLDIFYEAFELFKSKTVLDVDTSRFKKFYSSFKGEKYEDITITFSTCTIETDWVDAIERGIPWIEKAIKEERQFIRNDSEVLPIEKIRKVSKDSIQDLAKHSNYITHEPEPGSDDMLIPDKMLMIHKESDYAIYENRVLYATLVYLRDFVSSRLNKIKELTNRYEAETYAKKTLDLGNRKIEYDLHVYETRNNDPIVSAKNSAYDIIKRLDDIMSNIIALLKRPLMMELSRVEMVSRPITKTNILRMNHNFRESLACFDYIANYNSPGYVVKTMKRRFNPFSIEMMDSYAEVAMLISFLTYAYGNNLTGDLRKKYLENIDKRKVEEEERVLQKLKSIHARAEQEGKTVAEYFLIFENGYRILEKRLENIDRELKGVEIKHKEELAKQKEYYEGELDKQEKEYEKEKEQILFDKEQEIARINEEAQNRINEEVAKNNEETSEIRAKMNADRDELIKNTNAKVNELETAKRELEEKVAQLEADNLQIKSQIQGILIKGGTSASTDEMVTEEAFDELEKTKVAFDRYYEEAWKKAKAQIRKDTLVIKKKEKNK